MGSPSKMSWAIEVRPARHGRGVFATRRLQEGELVECCPTVELLESDVTGVLRDYIFASVSDDHVVIVLGYGMLYNHSADPNLEYLQERTSTIEFYAQRVVEPGEELTISYDSEWWASRGLETG